MTRLAVLADPHCDDFGSKIDPETGLNARWVDTVGMVRWVAEDAAKRGADALIVAGDLSEARHPAPWRVAQIDAAIAAFGGPVILCRGNHDGSRAGLSIVDVLAAGRPTWSGFSRPGYSLVGDVAIAVIPYLDRSYLRAQPGFEAVPDADIYRVLAEEFLTLARGMFVQASSMAARTILVVHQALSGGSMSDAQRAFLGDVSLVVDTAGLASIGYDAILAGHFHKHQVLSADPLIAYAGSPYRTDFGEEHQAKGYLFVDVEADGTTWQFRETPARRFVTLTGDAFLDDHQLAAAHVRDAVVRVVDLDPLIDPTQVRRALEELDAFEVQEIRTRAVDAPEVVGGIDESLTPEAALSEYFAGDPDRDALVELGREILQAVGS